MLVRRSWIAATFAAAAIVPSAVRCQTVAEVQVTPETMTLGVGQKQQVFAAAYDRQGNLLPNAKFTFGSSDTSIARVLPDGTVIGVQPGLAKVEARVARRRASLAVLITANQNAADKPPAGTVLTLDPVSLVLLPGETARMTPHAQRDDGSEVALDRVTWKSLKPTVATVDTAGQVAGVSNGTTIIQVLTANGLMATAPIEVASADFAVTPDRLRLTPHQIDTLRLHVPTQDDRILRNGVTWQSLDTAVARVGTAGVAEAVAPGKTELVATGFGREHRVPVLVHPTPDALEISPSSRERILVPRHGTRHFTAMAEAADSTPIPEIPVAWALHDTATAAFDTATGMLTAKAVGVTMLTATIDSFKPVIWTIEVIPGFVRLHRDRVALAPGGRTSIPSELVDDRGASIGDMSELQWASDRPDIASVDADGTIHGVAPGRAMITATAPWGQSDTATALVTGDLLVSSDRGGTFGLYALVRARPDTLYPVLTDGTAAVDGIYSPDRTQIAFSANRGGAGYDLYLADADGRNARRLTTDTGDERAPVWMPDGRRLLYTFTPAEPNAAPRIRIIDADGRNSRTLLAGAGESVAPAVSADGRRIAVVALRDKHQDLYLITPDDSAAPPQRITDNGDRELLPQFFPNGDLLYAVERGHGRSARLVRWMAANGENTKLFEIDQPLVALSLSPDGTTMAYAAGKLTDPAKGHAKFGLYLRPTVGDGPPVAIPLHPDERIASVAF